MRDDAPVQRPLVPLQRQQEVGPAADDLLRDGRLDSHRVDGDDRAADIDQLEQLGNRRALWRLKGALDFSSVETCPSVRP